MTLKLKPPKNSIKSQEEKLSSFIKEAEYSDSSGALNVLKEDKKEDIVRPWENPAIRRDIKKVFNLRLNEEDFIKIDYLSRKTGISKHKICVDILIPEINKKLQKITE